MRWLFWSTWDENTVAMERNPVTSLLTFTPLYPIAFILPDPTELFPKNGSEKYEYSR